jgi:hypothetical protein
MADDGESWLRMSSFRPSQRREAEVPVPSATARLHLSKPMSAAPLASRPALPEPLPAGALPGPSLAEERLPADKRSARAEKRRRGSSSGADGSKRGDGRGTRDLEELVEREPPSSPDRPEEGGHKRHRRSKKDRARKEKKEKKKRRDKDKAKRRPRGKEEEGGEHRAGRRQPSCDLSAPPSGISGGGPPPLAGNAWADTDGGPTDLEKRVARDRVMLIEDPRASVPARWQVCTIQVGEGVEEATPAVFCDRAYCFNQGQTLLQGCMGSRGERFSFPSPPFSCLFRPSARHFSTFPPHS